MPIPTAPGPTARILPRGSPSRPGPPRASVPEMDSVFLERGGQREPHRAPSQDRRDRRDRQRPGFYRQPGGSRLRHHPAAAFRQYRCERRQRHFSGAGELHVERRPRGGSPCPANTGGTANGPVGYTVAANVCASQRTGAISVTSYTLRQQFQIIQDGSPGNFATSTTSVTVPPAGVTGNQIQRDHRRPVAPGAPPWT